MQPGDDIGSEGRRTMSFFFAGGFVFEPWVLFEDILGSVAVCVGSYQNNNERSKMERSEETKRMAKRRLTSLSNSTIYHAGRPR